jgi:hypothetical protein
LLGVGPFQSGTIYEKPRFAGAKISLPLVGAKSSDDRRQTISLDQEFVFARPPEPLPDPENAVQHASAETVETTGKPSAEKAAPAKEVVPAKAAAPAKEAAVKK